MTGLSLFPQLAKRTHVLRFAVGNWEVSVMLMVCSTPSSQQPSPLASAVVTPGSFRQLLMNNVLTGAYLPYSSPGNTFSFTSLTPNEFWYS